MNTPDRIKDARMGIAAENIQEILDAADSTGNALQNGQNQFQTPDWLARGLAALLPHGSYSAILDPQCAAGQLVKAVPGYVGAGDRMGIELDRRFMGEKAKQGAAFEDFTRITGNCVKVMATFDELSPDAKFNCIVANPPFAIRWKQPDGTAIDSTQWTWNMIKARLNVSGAGFLISNFNTLERLGITRDPWAYLSQRFPVGGVWEGVNVQLGIVHFYNGELRTPRIDRDWTHVPSEKELADFSNTEALSAIASSVRYPYSSISVRREWEMLAKVVTEEAGNNPKWNIYLNKDGMLRTYLSTRSAMKVNRDEIARLARINGCHPLTLTTERETRKLMHEYLTAGTYTIQPEARVAISQALTEVASLACPLRPVTDFESVAYAEEEEQLKCKAAGGPMAMTVGKFYEIRTGTYTFKDKFSRKKVHYDEETEKTEIEDHDCELSGEDRYIEVTDDRGRMHRFMDRPTQGFDWQHPETMLWEVFERPYVPTVAEVCSSQYERNLNAMRFNEMVAGFSYFPGQLDYYARMACKDYGLVAADVGCHAKGTPIMLADGTNKLVEDVAVGDTLMGWDNTPRCVTRLSRGRQEMARITPIKGESFVVNLDHILTLVQTNTHHSRPMAKTNGRVVDVTVRNYLGWSKEARTNHKLFRRGIELPKRDVTFSPYFMGVYLGDGSCSHDDLQVSITKPDPEIRAAVAAECKAHGWGMRTYMRDENNPSHFIKGGAIKQWLRKLGLYKLGSGERFIPDSYKFNSRGVRIQVLAGLLDTDGHLERCGTFDYISQSRRLADDVVWLARSVGLAAYVAPCEKRDQNGQGGTYHRVTVSGDLDMIPTRIPRKQAAPRKQKKDVLRTGFSVELLPVDDFYGFSIEGDGRFLLGDFTVTHNTGKSLGALTLITLKSPKRTLLIAPQGTMRSVGDEDEIDYQASQWVKEIQRFAPGEPVFQLFDQGDLQNILHANAGELPAGIYITYPQAFFSNGAFEHMPATWGGQEEQRFCKRFGYEFTNERAKDDYLSRNIGAANDKGIRCIWEPSLATLIECRFGDVFEMVVIDESHLCCNLEANVTKNLLRLQPKYRFALTATPIPNIVSNIFSLMGWLCVPGWHKGGIRNAAWPYAVDEIGRFNTTFLSTEVDLTAQNKARAAGKKSWRQSGTRFSPIISSPARLLKLLKPSMAYISKEDCNPNVVGCEIIDVRVATGKEQSKLYEYWLDRKNYVNEFKSMLTIAQVQSSRLRGVCASPASLDYTRGMCKSNFNRKLVTILQLIRDRLQCGEQVVVVSARVGQSAALASRLNECGIPVSRIDSTVAAELHTAEANRFKNGDSRVMLMGIKCAQGHSFDQCPNLIIGSLEWSYGTLHQAKGRVHRLTSPKQVKIWCVLHKNTIEELLFDRVALKQDAATLCLHGKRVPRDFKTLDASEILAEHIVNFDASDGEVLSESECESQWHALRKQLVIANRSPRQLGTAEEFAA